MIMHPSHKAVPTLYSIYLCLVKGYLGCFFVCLFFSKPASIAIIIVIILHFVAVFHFGVL